jgi:beta-N-acetylhexosaminidase
VLLGSNITTRAALIRLTSKLQEAAAAGGQPPLLIALDQEGGSVKRVPWAPPTLTVPAMGRLSAKVARRQGQRTGAALRALGVNMDLAPVADIPRSAASFMYQQGRTFGFDAGRTAAMADAFARGLADGGVIATMKHFPGIGRATRNTDRYVDTIGATAAELAVDLGPYRRAIANGLPAIMLSNATYPAWDDTNAAGWSRAIAVSLVRDELGFRGITITDSLDGTGHARGLPVRVLGLRAAIAGTDMILTTGSERTTTKLFEVLLARANEGSLPRATLQASYDRILEVKTRAAPPARRG